MQKLRWLAILMGITIVGITGFQLYWLKDNYDREKNTVNIKTEVAFRETILQLQASKLKLDVFKTDSLNKGKVKIFTRDGEQVKVRFNPRTEIISTINVIRDKLKDSLKKDVKTDTIISMNKISAGNDRDSAKFIQKGSFTYRQMPGRGPDHIFNLLYGVDSLQDSLKLQEINIAYKGALKEQKLNIPFSILRIDSAGNEEQAFNEVTVGFIKPITYRMELGNTFPYLLKRITSPILFSIFLLGITILSFVLLYRNLLKQRRLAELKNEFISNITHELKTPIATVGVAIEALQNFNAVHDPQRTKEYLDISQNELQRLSLLVDKVLKLSMFEKRKMELKREQFDYRQLVKEVMTSMKLQFAQYNAKVNLRTEGENFLMEADKLHIKSVVYNLLDNALKYSKENPVIDVQLKSHPEYIELSISDNGIGIEPVYKEKIFEKFFRVPSGNRHNTKGYGLGLSYVKDIAKRHHGFIEVESKLDKGSTFSVKLPYAEASVIHYDKGRVMRKEVL
jgi:two-component system phosphate regulon sensor histidine kinase PhoR